LCISEIQTENIKPESSVVNPTKIESENILPIFV